MKIKKMINFMQVTSATETLFKTFKKIKNRKGLFYKSNI